MRNVVIICVISLALVGCGRVDRWWAGTTGQPVDICHDGVVYVQLTSGASVKYNQDGSIATCRK